MKLFYLHIPKTGGQTLARRLSSAFPLMKSKIMFGDLVYPEGAKKLEELLSTYDFVESHVAGRVLSQMMDAEILATVRSPVEQLISNYLHIKREPLNSLHRIANRLSPERFFAEYGDFVKNHQSRYLVSAFRPFDTTADDTKFLVDSLYESLNRVRWCVPTESIDEFLNLWSIENRMDVPNTQESLNFAPNKERYADLVEVVHRFSHLYSVDLLLWDIVRTRYAAYRARVLRDASSIPYPDNVSKAFSAGDLGIWLREGWHPAQQVQGGRNEWWAGPDRFSVVKYKKDPQHRFIKFAVSVVCGIRRADIKAATESRQEEIPTELKSMEGDRHELWIDLGGLPDEGALTLCVPEVCSPMMMDAKSDDLLRKSFAGVDWSFA